MSLHVDIEARLIATFGARLTAPPRQALDALEIQFDTDLVLQIRYPDADEYSLRWHYRERVLGIDTAPLHSGLDSFPNHLHDRDGRIVADRFTRPGLPAWENLQPLIARLLEDPRLEST